MTLNNDKMTKCVECKYKTKDKNIGVFQCKKCVEDMKKPIDKWFILISLFAGIFFISFYELSTISLIIGICLGLLIQLNFRRNEEAKQE